VLVMFCACVCAVTHACSCSILRRGQQLLQPNSSNHNGALSPLAICTSWIERSDASVKW